MNYPLRIPEQLKPHLRALRKSRGLTQAQLGALVGVKQARIAEIEANPGAVSLDQLVKVLGALGATFTCMPLMPTRRIAQRPTRLHPSSAPRRLHPHPKRLAPALEVREAANRRPSRSRGSAPPGSRPRRAPESSFRPRKESGDDGAERLDER
jgi:HTH-type transcriptional regulator/antitoxin HipB